jgi:hypothetical protein
MITSSNLMNYVKAQPFRPFRLHMASGKTFDVRHPEMVKLGKNFIMAFSFSSREPELVEQWETVSLMLIESVSHLDAAVEA